MENSNISEDLPGKFSSRKHDEFDSVDDTFPVKRKKLHSQKKKIVSQMYEARQVLGAAKLLDKEEADLEKLIFGCSSEDLEDEVEEDFEENLTQDNISAMPEKKKNEESDDPRYSGVMDINPNLDAEEEPLEEMEYNGEKEEEFRDKEEDEGQRFPHNPLRCRTIRIGSYSVHPPAGSLYVAVFFSLNSLSFQAPMISDSKKRVHITLGENDIIKKYVHFGRRLPVMFIFTTPKFGEFVRKALHMIPNETPYFDPTAIDDKTQKLTFLIESITNDQKFFIKDIYTGSTKVVHMGYKSANEILVRSTPNQPDNIGLSKTSKKTSMLSAVKENKIDSKFNPAKKCRAIEQVKRG